MPPPAVPIPAATFARRLAAAGLDATIYVAASTALVIPAAAVNGWVHTTAALTAAVATAAVFIGNDIVLVARTGQSLGKRCLSIRVVDSRSGRLPFWEQVFFRNVIRCAGFGYAWHPIGAIGYLVIVGPWPVIDFLPAVADSRWHRALHDRWAHTVVIDARVEYLPYDESDGADRAAVSSL